MNVWFLRRRGIINAESHAKSESPPFRSAPIFTRNAHSLLFASPNVKRVGLAMRPRSVFLPPMGVLEAIFNPFPFPARLFSFSSGPFALRPYLV